MTEIEKSGRYVETYYFAPESRPTRRDELTLERVNYSDFTSKLSRAAVGFIPSGNLSESDRRTFHYVHPTTPGQKLDIELYGVTNGVRDPQVTWCIAGTKEETRGIGWTAKLDTSRADEGQKIADILDATISKILMEQSADLRSAVAMNNMLELDILLGRVPEYNSGAH